MSIEGILQRSPGTRWERIEFEGKELIRCVGNQMAGNCRDIKLEADGRVWRTGQRVTYKGKEGTIDWLVYPLWPDGGQAIVLAFQGGIHVGINSFENVEQVKPEFVTT